MKTKHTFERHAGQVTVYTTTRRAEIILSILPSLLSKLSVVAVSSWHSNPARFRKRVDLVLAIAAAEVWGAYLPALKACQQ